MTLPNSVPRPPGELEALERIWEPPRGWRVLSAVNNTYVGLFYIGTALLFFVLAGILALLMRAQLAVPENDLVGHDTFNQLFTMHGTVMMFLFAVPAVEAMAVYLLPNMLAARDLPFPRLSAFAFWAYFFGGLAFFCSLFFGLAPDGGWFMYPPLTSFEFSPGHNSDFWLLGIGFIEISAIAGAVEIVVGVLRDARARHDACAPAGLRLGDAGLRRHDHLRLSRRSSSARCCWSWSAPSTGRSSSPTRAATRCSGSTSSGSSATRRSTSSSCRRPAWCR